MRGLATILFLCVSALAQDSSVLQLRTRVALPNVNGRIDHLSADTKGQRLFVAALGNHTVEVIDLKSSRVVKTLSDLAEPQGILYAPSGNRLFVASALDGSAKLFDATTFQLLATARFSKDADNVRYDAEGKRIIVGYGDGALGFLDLNGAKTGEIALDAHPESFQLEQNGPRAFVNVPDRKEVEVVDLRKGVVLARWPITVASKNYPMALDEAHHRLLIGCRSPARLLVIDTESGKVAEPVEIVGDTDDIFYDAARRRVYVIGGGGSVDVFQQKSADNYQRVGRIPTAPGARTGLFVAEWNQLVVAVPHRGAQAAEVLVYEIK